MRPGDLLMVDASRKGAEPLLWLVLDGEGLYTVAREGDLLLHTGTRRELSGLMPGKIRTLWCFILRGKPCHLDDAEFERVRRSLRLLSQWEAA